MTLNYQPVDHSSRRWYYLWSGGDPWYKPHRLWRFYDVVHTCKPDIIGLQEITPAMALGIADLLSSQYCIAETYNTPYTQTLCNPIMYKPSQCTLKELAVPLTRNERPEDASGSEDSVITHAMFDDNKGSHISVYNVHLHYMHGEQSHEADTLRKLYDSDRQRNRTPFTVGDFNTHMHHASHYLNMANAYTRNTYTYIPRSAHNASSGHRIDGILYDSSYSDKEQSSVVVYADEIGLDGFMHQENRLSDHRPVIADFHR